MKRILYLILSIIFVISSLSFTIILFDVIFNPNKYNSIVSDIIKCLILGGVSILIVIVFVKKYINLSKNIWKQKREKKEIEKQKLIEEKNRIQELKKQEIEQRKIEEQKKIDEEEKRKNAFLKRGAELFPNDYIVFDLETTGLSPQDNKIIEIGAIKYKNNEKCEEFNVLINPQIELPSKIIELTGITDEMLKDCETIDKVLPRFIEFIEDLPLVAHNSSFDRSFIFYKAKELGIKEITNKDIDTLELSRRYIYGVVNHKLRTLKIHLGIENASHRSIADCETANAVFQHCKTNYYNQEI